MNLTPVWLARVDETGRIKPDRRHDFLRYVKGFAGQPVEVIVRKPRKQRSQRANAYYWSTVVKLIAEHCGYESDEMHELMALRFLRIEDDPITGSPRRRRTPETNTAEFAEYVDQCIRFGAELGVVIPAPGEVEAA